MALRTLRAERSSSDSAAHEYERLRDRLIVSHLGLAHHLAAKFGDRGEPLPDLFQVAALGLINAIDRYDPDRGVEFSTFATPTILGEIKRYFRDRGWAIKAPRRLRELNASILRAVDALTGEFGRAPNVNEIAERLGVSTEEVLAARELAAASVLVSLDEPVYDDGRHSLADSVGAVEAELDGVIERLSLERALAVLNGRERAIVLLRFFDGASQSEVARRLDVSQMQISRLQQKALAKLRSELEEWKDGGQQQASS